MKKFNDWAIDKKAGGESNTETQTTVIIDEEELKETVVDAYKFAYQKYEDAVASGDGQEESKWDGVFGHLRMAMEALGIVYDNV